jgi:putative protease
MSKARVLRYKRTSKLDDIVVSESVQGENLDAFTFSAAAFTVDQAKVLIDFKVEVIYYKDINTFKEVYDYAKESEYNGELIPEVFRGFSDSALANFVSEIKDLDIKTVLISSYGHMDLFADYDLIIDYNMNVLNDYSYDYYMKKKNIKRVTLSPEMNLEQIAALKSTPERTEVLGFGYLPVMLLKHCVIATTLGNGLNCGACSEDNYGLKDKTDLVFKLKKREGCMLEVYNSKKLLLIDCYKGLMEAGVGAFRLNFTTETPEEIEEILEVHYAMVNDNLKGSLSAKYIELKEVGVTRGHLNRGVL